MVIILYILLTVLLGSFANNVISYFIGKSKFDLFRSTCPTCNHVLKARDLIPICSFLMLKGKCSECNNPISLRYFIVESSIIFLSIVCLWVFENELIAFANFLFVYILFLIAVIDFYTLKIPNILTTILFTILLFKLSIFSKPNGADFIAAVIILLSLTFINMGYSRFRNQTAIGFGDIKLLFVLTLICSWQLSLIGLWISSLIGVLISFLYIKKRKIQPIKLPFAVFIFGGYTTIILFSNQINSFLYSYIYGI